MASKGMALVTGASAGIGNAYARRLAKEGYGLVLVARGKERLDALSAELSRAHQVNAEVLVADLSKENGIASVEQRAGQGDITLLVNNAGFGGYRPFAQLDPSTANELITIHVTAPLRVTRAALPAMLSRKSGGVITLASLLSLSGSIPPNPLPFRATYAASKAFQLTFMQTLWGELKDSGVRLQVVLPGVVATEFHDDYPPEAKERIQQMAMSADDVVHASLTALARGELICVPGLDEPQALEKLFEAQRAVMGAANRSKRSARYD